MIEHYIGKTAKKDIFMSAMLSGLMNEKQAATFLDGIEKNAQTYDILKGIGSDISSGLGNIASGLKNIWSGAKEVPSTLGWLALMGGGSGVLGATAYDAIKERLANEDPEEKFNSDVETYYNMKHRELEDAKWMSRVRAMRDDLKRNYKKMTTEEYAAKYKALSDALDEKKELS